MTRYDSTRRAWEDIWASASVDQELETMTYPRAVETLNAYLPYLPKDEIVLEAGSGLSAVILTLKRIGYRVMGLDYAVNALEISRHYDPDLALVAGDVHHLPYAANTFGAYLSFGVFEHFETGMRGPLAEAYRILKPGGVLVLTIPYPNVVNQLLAWRRKRAGLSVLNDDEFFESTYTRDALTGAVKSVGFEIVQVVPTSHAYTLWGIGAPFRAPGYYRTNALAEGAGRVLKAVLPWPFNFSTLVIARKR